MSGTFQSIRFKVKAPNIRGLWIEFLRAIDEGYMIRALPTKNSSTMCQTLVSLEAVKAGLTFLLDLFMESYLHFSNMTPIQLTSNSWAYMVEFAKYMSLFLKLNKPYLYFGLYLLS